MSLNHVRKPIHNHSDLLAACQYAASQVRLFQLSMERLEAVFEIDVFSLIARVPTLSILDHEFLVSYARGYQASLAHSIVAVECEFVFRSKVGVLFSTKVGIESRPHFGMMTTAEREESTSGYAWLKTGSPFTAFTRKPGLFDKDVAAINDANSKEYAA